MLFRAGCSIGEIVTITGHSLRRAQDILDKYLARTSQLAESAIAKFENVLETDFAKRSAKRSGQSDVKWWRAGWNKTANTYVIEISLPFRAQGDKRSRRSFG